MQIEWLDSQETDPPAGLDDLLKVGVTYRQLDLKNDFQGALDALKASGGYIEQDIVELRPDSEGLESTLDAFAREHRHADDEVRLVLDGEGIFDLRSHDERWIRATLTSGDLLVVPKQLYHRFFLTKTRTIRCVRLFGDPAGWIADYRDGASENTSADLAT